MTPPSVPDTDDDPRLSIVLACTGEAGAAAGALRALRRGTRGVTSEVLVVRRAGRAPVPAGRHRAVRMIEGPRGALVPGLWGAGLRAARGWAVAFTTSHCRVEDGWAASLLSALEEGAVGAGGPIRLADGMGAFARAVHLLRYSDFAGGRPAGPVEEIPGDNAAYRREALEEEGVVGDEGFWDVEVHRRLRARGEKLVWVPKASVRMESTERMGVFVRQRFRHGRRFGRYRSLDLETSPWRSLLAAPLVPAVLTARAFARTGTHPGRLVRSLPALPHLLLTSSAWAAGEARGAVEVLLDRGGDEKGGEG